MFITLILDVTPNDSSTLNKINHSISKSSASTSTLTNHKIKMTKGKFYKKIVSFLLLNNIYVPIGDHFKKENAYKKHKKKAKNIDIHVNQNNGFGNYYYQHIRNIFLLHFYL